MLTVKSERFRRRAPDSSRFTFHILLFTASRLQDAQTGLFGLSGSSGLSGLSGLTKQTRQTKTK